MLDEWNFSARILGTISISIKSWRLRSALWIDGSKSCSMGYMNLRFWDIQRAIDQHSPRFPVLSFSSLLANPVLRQSPPTLFATGLIRSAAFKHILCVLAHSSFPNQILNPLTPLFHLCAFGESLLRPLSLKLSAFPHDVIRHCLSFLQRGHSILCDKSS
ncbi:hypothetical protein BDZ91DRAFT_406374 [Kalaharituber pfeilii]|nr:hypothetical protein BDZ91DRAFT_406374 [Kalaharituber pfeilii]